MLNHVCGVKIVGARTICFKDQVKVQDSKKINTNSKSVAETMEAIEVHSRIGWQKV